MDSIIIIFILFFLMEAFNIQTSWVFFFFFSFDIFQIKNIEKSTINFASCVL